MSDYQTTVRLDAALKSSVDHLKTLQKTTLNRLINDALAKYIGEILDEKRETLDASQHALHAYLASDPDFEAAIADIAASESAGHPDPAEGQIVTQTVHTKGAHNDDDNSSILAILDG
jgi:predicted transcriptional regulator